MTNPLTEKTKFELFLLSRMRSRDRVASARSRLGCSESDMNLAADWVTEQGLAKPGVRIEEIERHLGVLSDYENRESEDPYQRVAKKYTLESVPQFDLVILGDERGVSSGVRFERKTGAIANVDFRKIQPWESVEDDLLRSGEFYRIVDEWYPMKDYSLELTDGSELVLCFDFGLLQQVKVST